MSTITFIKDNEILILDNNNLAVLEKKPWKQEPNVIHQFVSRKEALYQLELKGYKIIRVEG